MNEEKERFSTMQAMDSLGKPFSYGHRIDPGWFMQRSSNHFQITGKNGKEYLVVVQGVFNDDPAAYEKSLATTCAWFVEQLRRAGGQPTREILSVNTYGWKPAASIKLGSHLDESFDSALSDTKLETLQALLPGRPYLVGFHADRKWLIRKLEKGWVIISMDNKLSRGGYDPSTRHVLEEGPQVKLICDAIRGGSLDETVEEILELSQEEPADGVGVTVKPKAAGTKTPVKTEAVEKLARTKPTVKKPKAN